ncbi:MAG TPA: C39 family peptidase [Spirochaetota bacterium]|nr:C39 family peptidase [Spirochaetota bacterium]HPK55389.1 C39 family peptidase [Spirochaetota bacterium]
MYNIKGGKVIAMDYMYQGDNKTNDQGKYWKNTCSVTGEAMLFKYMGITQKNPDKLYPDELYDELKNKGRGGPKLTNNIPGNTDELLKEYGYGDKYQKNFKNENYNTWKKMIKDKIDEGKPVIAGGYTTASGHIMDIVGYDEKGFILHDPAGDRKVGYFKEYENGKKNEDGKYVHYTYEQCKQWEIGYGRGWTGTIERR